MLTELLLIFVFLMASGFFSGVEIAYISADRLRIELEKKKGTRKGRIVSNFIDNPSQFLGTTLVGNNIVLIIFSIFTERFIKETMGLESAVPDEFAQLLLITLITTIVVLFFGEFLPKVTFRATATQSLFLFALPFQLVRWILTPFVWVMVKSSYAILRIFLGIRPQDDQQVFTKLDLEHFIRSTKPSNLDEIDQTLFQNALYISTVKVRDCMIPRNEIQSIDINSTIEELRLKFIESRNSRIIVYEDSIDEIKGYVHHQKLLENPTSIHSILFKIPIINEFMSSRDLMNRLIKEKINIAWVVDEFGGTAGIVTLEDLLEEIVGDISDEYDPEPLHEKVSDTEYLFSGRLYLDYINEEYGLNLPECDDYHTLSGFLVAEMETIPEQDSSFHINNFEFIFEEVSDTRIEVIRVRRLFDSDDDDDDN
jgi:putative hemolysin